MQWTIEQRRMKVDPYRKTGVPVNSVTVEEFSCCENHLRARVIAAHETAYAHPLRQVMLDYAEESAALFDKYRGLLDPHCTAILYQTHVQEFRLRALSLAETCAEPSNAETWDYVPGS